MEKGEALGATTTRCVSLENGLCGSLLELLPLSRAFSSSSPGRLERTFLLIRKVRASVELSVVDLDSFRRYKEKACGGKNRSLVRYVDT
jgi:hypothetical protein